MKRKPRKKPLSPLTVPDTKRLSDDEVEILFALAEAWSIWAQLDAKHPDDNADMRHAIHAAQMLVAGRVARRVDPDIWWTVPL